MKLDSISALSEIAPYYGKLDDVFRLMKKLNIKTNRMWETTWVQLSKEINRKKISFDWRSRKEFVGIPLKCPLLLTLFETSVINIQEEEFNWLIELYENIENPKMLSMELGLSLRTRLDAYMTLKDYQEYIEDTDFDNLDLYNKVVEIAIERGIYLNDINSFVYFDDLPRLKDVKYIKFIVIIWNQESDVDLIIKNWINFYESKEVDFKEVWLIWDGMWIKDFIKIFSILCNKKFETGVVTKRDWKQLALFLDEINSLQINNSYFKMGDDEEFVIWDRKRETSQTSLKKWYYKSNAKIDYAFKITDVVINHSNESITKDSRNFIIKNDNVECLFIHFKPININDEIFINFSNSISFNDNMIQFSSSIIKYSELRVNKDDNWINLLDWKIQIESSAIFRVSYWHNESGIQLDVQNVSLKIKEIDPIIKNIKSIGYVAKVSLTIEDPSAALTFLNFCIELLFLNSIVLQIKKKPCILEKFEIGDIANELKNLKKRVKIIWHNISG